jgi:hypothetical protein
MSKLDKEVEQVGEIMDRLVPMVERYIHRLVAQHGPTVAISVASNTATTLMAYALTVVERHGGDPEEMWRLLRLEVLTKTATLQIHNEQSHTLQ